MTQSNVQIPVGPPPIIRTVSSFPISVILLAQYPVAKISPTNKASSSGTLSGILLSPWFAHGTRTYSACPPSILHPSARPPFYLHNYLQSHSCKRSIHHKKFLR